MICKAALYAEHLPNSTMTTLDDPKNQMGQYRWYHSIPIGNGLFTPGKRSYENLSAKLDMMQLPDDLTGCSLLDIGCNEGFYAIEAWQRGASTVLGLDNQQRKDVAAKFALIKKLLGHGADFREWDVEDTGADDPGPFDIVLFLSVFHHLRYPFYALDRVASLTGNMAIMEFVVADSKPEDDSPQLLRGFGHKGKLRLIPNRWFLLEMLHWSGFRDVELLGAHSRRRYDGLPVEAEKVMLRAHK